MQTTIYLDYNATTPVDPLVAAAMEPFLSARFGNASSAHAYGSDASAAIDRARSQIAAAIGAEPDEIVCTGGGSETDNLAIKGAVFAHLDRQPHVVTTAVEHAAVLTTLDYLRRRFGTDLTVLPVDEYGQVSADAVRRAIRPNTVLVSVMHANNEVGTLQPIREIARATRAAGVLFHIDAAQSMGKVTVNVKDLDVDLLTIAGHKLYGPKGIGALYIRRGVVIDPLIHGSGQEFGMRAGTQPVASIVGLGRACELMMDAAEGNHHRVRELRDCLHAALARHIPGLELNGHPDHRLPNTLNVSFPGVRGHTLLAQTPEIAASTGSACHSGSDQGSPILLAMGLSAQRAVGAVRLSLGRWTTAAEVTRAADLLGASYKDLMPTRSAAAPC